MSWSIFEFTRAVGHSDLSGVDRAILMNIAFCADSKTGVGYPGYEYLAKTSGFAIRTVSNSVARLSKTGFLEVRKRHGKSTVYQCRTYAPSATPARDTPLHEMPDTPAPGACTPLHEMPDTPAPGAYDPLFTGLSEQHNIFFEGKDTPEPPKKKKPRREKSAKDIELDERAERVWDEFNVQRSKAQPGARELQLSPKRRTQIRARLIDVGEEEVFRVMTRFFDSSLYWAQNGNNPDHLFRGLEQFDKVSMARPFSPRPTEERSEASRRYCGPGFDPPTREERRQELEDNERIAHPTEEQLRIIKENCEKIGSMC